MVSRFMTEIGVLLIVFVLLLMVKQLNERLFPLLFIVVLCLMLFYFWTTIWRPFIEKLLALFTAVPYSRQLLMTVSLLLIGDVLQKMMSQFDMESFGFLVVLSVRITILAIWLEPIEQLLGHFQQMSSLFGQ